MSRQSRTVPVIYERSVWKSESERRLPSYHNPYKNKYSSYDKYYPYDLGSDYLNDGTSYSYDKETSRHSDEMRRTWDDKFKKIAPRADDWKLTDNISQRLSPIEDLSLDPVAYDDWKRASQYKTVNPIKEDAYGKRTFRLEYDMKDFKPEEITVKVNNGFITINAKHEEKGGPDSSKREYSRQYLLPAEVQPELLSSKLSITGKLTIEAPIFSSNKRIGDRIIPVKQGY